MKKYEVKAINFLNWFFSDSKEIENFEEREYSPDECILIN